MPGDAALIRGRRLFQLWFRTVTVAEFIGFAVPASVGAATASVETAIAVPAVLAAGAIEGAILGWGQARVLRRCLPAVSRRHWIMVTASAAVFAYALGLTWSTFNAAMTAGPPALTAVIALGLGVILLTSIGTAQWLVLRAHVADASRWIWATAVAWLAGLAVFLVFVMPLWRPGQSLALVVAIGIAGGLLMAATMSLITGRALRRLVG